MAKTKCCLVLDGGVKIALPACRARPQQQPGKFGLLRGTSSGSEEEGDGSSHQQATAPKEATDHLCV
jgi:hypothetical protein